MPGDHWPAVIGGVVQLFPLWLEAARRHQYGNESFVWRKHDVFTVPHWNWVSHRAMCPEAHLFMFTDREILRRTGLLREETMRR